MSSVFTAGHDAWATVIDHGGSEGIWDGVSRDSSDSLDVTHLLEPSPRFDAGRVRCRHHHASPVYSTMEALSGSA